MTLLVSSLFMWSQWKINMSSSLERAIKMFYKSCNGCPLINPELGCVVGECPFDIIMRNHDEIVKSYSQIIRDRFFEPEISK